MTKHPDPAIDLSTYQPAMDTLYTLYIEDTRHAITPIVRRYFDGCSVIMATGMWRKHVENTLRIEIIADATRSTREKIAALASDLATTANQTEILVTETPVSVYHFGKSIATKDAVTTPTPGDVAAEAIHFETLTQEN